MIVFFILHLCLVLHDTTALHDRQRIEAARQATDEPYVGQERLRYRHNSTVTNRQQPIQDTAKSLREE